MTEKKQKKFQKWSTNSDRLFLDIEKACEGLIYISETDTPVTAFRPSFDTDLSGPSMLQQIESKPENHVEEIAFQDFFSRLTAVKEWFGEAEKDRAKKFLDLQKLIEENLSSLKVFKIGKIRIKIFAVGTDKLGSLMGITTSAVET